MPQRKTNQFTFRFKHGHVTGPRPMGMDKLSQVFMNIYSVLHTKVECLYKEILFKHIVRGPEQYNKGIINTPNDFPI